MGGAFIERLPQNAKKTLIYAEHDATEDVSERCQALLKFLKTLLHLDPSIDGWKMCYALYVCDFPSDGRALDDNANVKRAITHTFMYNWHFQTIAVAKHVLCAIKYATRTRRS